MTKLTIDVTLKFRQRFVFPDGQNRSLEDVKDSILRITSKKLEGHKKDYPEMQFTGYDWSGK